MGATVRVERSGFVMGTELRLTLDAPARTTALMAAEGALREVERLDALLTTWNDASPMSILNLASVGRAVEADAELIELFVEARRWAVHTGGAFEPAIGSLIEAWGLRSGGNNPSAETLAAARAASGPENWTIDQRSRTVTRQHPEAWIDTGGFGKGAALRSARDTLLVHGTRSGLLDLGGQLLAVGRDATTGQPWSVAVAHPSRRQEPVGTLHLEDVSVATSSYSERSVSLDGQLIGHVIDPRVGRPAARWGSVTVVTADPLVADVLSTALYVLGPEAGLELADDLSGDAVQEGLGDVGVLFQVERQGSLEFCWNAAMERWLGMRFAATSGSCGAEGDHADRLRG